MLWNVCSVVVDFFLKRSVVLHDTLHGFKERRGVRKLMLEANLAYQMERLAHGPLFQFFLDVYKAYY